MSTRCNISIIDSDLHTILLYHHHDGYLSGVGMDLVKQVKLLQDRSYDTDEFATMLIKRQDDTEYELSTQGLHGDIEYLYQVNLTKKKVFVVMKKGMLVNVEDAIKDEKGEE